MSYICPSVSIDDLQEDSNKECTICYGDHTIGSSAVKLPCGHIYHNECLVPWLQKSASCPVCRYELQTNDPTYEKQRLARMKSRKLRVRKDDLMKKVFYRPKGNLYKAYYVANSD